MLLVARGPDRRCATPDGTRELAPGEVVAFPRGERGAHQLINDGDEPARFLVFSEMN